MCHENGLSTQEVQPFSVSETPVVWDTGEVDALQSGENEREQSSLSKHSADASHRKGCLRNFGDVGLQAIRSVVLWEAVESHFALCASKVLLMFLSLVMGL